MPRPRRRERTVEALRHEDDTRTNIPTAEYQSMMREEQEAPLQKEYQRRNRDLDPQLVWRGKDEPDRSDLVVHRHRLQPGELLRPPRLLPGRQRPVQVPENHPESRNRRRRLGHAAQRHLTPLPQTRHRTHRRQG